jgi:N6-L-threonylcarbamoyladenine synthase
MGKNKIWQRRERAIHKLGGYMKILSIDTSCDETSVAVTQKNKVLSNIIWSQASLHSKWGGVLPSLAQRQHKKKIDWVTKKALQTAGCKLKDINALAVTTGPGLAIALEVGIEKAKEISTQLDLPFIAVNHIEGHILSPLAVSRASHTSSASELNRTFFPALGLAASGGHTEVIHMKEIGKYHIIAQTRDDALGESLDKAARLLGFGYPGGEVLEKIAKDGNPKSYNLPVPMLGKEKRLYYSYSGLKTAFVRLINKVGESNNKFSKKETANLAASFQETAFTHFVRVLSYILKTNYYPVTNILAGGGVMANVRLRQMVRQVSKQHNITVCFPYSNKLYMDNAAMIGIPAYFKYKCGEFITKSDLDKVDRIPRAKIDKKFPWE